MYKVAASVLRGAGRAGEAEDAVSEAEDAVSEAILSIIATPPAHVQNRVVRRCPQVLYRAESRGHDEVTRGGAPYLRSPPEHRLGRSD
jgi:hypothetical protein